MLSFSMILSCIGASAQEASKGKEWNFLVEPYLMFPSMSGETGIRSLRAVEITPNAVAIFSNLKIGAMLYAEAQADNFAGTSVLLYMSLKEDATARQLGYQWAGFYCFSNVNTHGPVVRFGFNF